MKRGIFVTGTDTGVGKTLVSAALVHGFARHGLRSAGLKPVAAGCREQQGRLLSEDVELLQAAANVQLAPAIVNPYAFAPPIAPHLAAAQTGREIVLQTVLHAVNEAAQHVDVLVVEGVGGFRVPLNAREDTADLAVMLELPVVLVVGMRLGCLSHALLTAEAIAARGLKLAGWVANVVDRDMAMAEANIAALRECLCAPCLGVIPHLGQPEFRTAESELECGQLIKGLGV